MGREVGQLLTCAVCTWEPFWPTADSLAEGPGQDWQERALAKESALVPEDREEAAALRR